MHWRTVLITAMQLEYLMHWIHRIKVKVWVFQELRVCIYIYIYIYILYRCTHNQQVHRSHTSKVGV